MTPTAALAEENVNTKGKTMKKNFATMDGNEAVASIAYRTHEVIAIYPITPSSPMGELSDAWSFAEKPNLWGTIPTVVEMQSEAGAAGALHGALQAGALATTFTSSQGLLLMIPNMYKIAGELTPCVIHVAARSLAAQGLSIFGDHSDVMAARATGFAFLASTSVQEAMDLAVVTQAATLESRLPFVHFFDGFRTSHEVAKIELLSEDQIRAMLNEEWILRHREHALSPEHPVLRGTAQNPDVYFQARETVNPYYAACPEIVEKAMAKFKTLTGRSYPLYEYYGDPAAERLIVIMGSGAQTVRETAAFLNRQGGKVGLLTVRLYRPFDAKRFLEAIPASVKSIAVLDRTKEPGSLGEPLYLDCVAAVTEGLRKGWGQLKNLPLIVGGRYGLSSKEFTPAMVKGVFDNLAAPAPKNHFTVGIKDDVSHSSVDYDPAFSIEPENQFRALFFGLGSDGTVGANKNSIKIIGEKTDNYAQGYFVYDSKKAGAITISHLRFGPEEIRAPYLIEGAHFVACHQSVFLGRYDMLGKIRKGGVFLLNAPYGPAEVWDHLPRPVQEEIIRKQLKFYVIDAYKVAAESGLKGRINTVMQVCFFAISSSLPKEESIAAIKETIHKSYGKQGEEVVRKNLSAVDNALSHLHEVKVPAQATSSILIPPPVPENAPKFVREIIGEMIEGSGDELPVSALPADGSYPTATTQWERRNLAQEIPVWDPSLCIQCGKCAFVCPHAVIRIKAYEPGQLNGAPASFKSRDASDRDWKGLKYTIQVAPEDCTGCAMCVDFCPVKSKTDPRHKAINMLPQQPLLAEEKKNWDFFLKIPDLDRRRVNVSAIRQQQIQRPLFEFSSACAGCGETPYLKLVSQLFGDRMIIANATGCSSIYGGNLPTTPWAKDASGRGPAWANSLFEDNAEFGLGIRLAVDKQAAFAGDLLKKISGSVGEELAKAILSADQKDEPGIYEQRERVQILKGKLASLQSREAKALAPIADLLVRKSVWIVGGDGWAYDIGYGGLDHVLASGKNVKILVLDTEVYSNTGGQMSKSTPRSAVAKFAAGGKPAQKKDLGLMAITYGHVYVASVAMGAKDEHTLRSFLEAEAYPGTALIIAYSHCIAHGINMTTALQNQKALVDSGRFLLYRYNPERLKKGENPLQLDSPAPKIPVEQFLMMENRFKMLTKSKPELAQELFRESQEDVNSTRKLYEYLAARSFKPQPEPPK